MRLTVQPGAYLDREHAGESVTLDSRCQTPANHTTRTSLPLAELSLNCAHPPCTTD